MKLKERFPNHKLDDKADYQLQQFTAEEMIEYAEECAREALRLASESVNVKVVGAGYIVIDKQSILSHDNLPSHE